MANIFPQTPQRSAPGAYYNTPQTVRSSSYSSLAALNSQSNVLSRQPQIQGQPLPKIVEGENLQVTVQSLQSQPSKTVTQGERAARSINSGLSYDASYPELDNYIGQGISGDYIMADNMPLQPFQKTQSYQIPDQLFDQYNQAQLNTQMGLFASIGIVWTSIDNSLYLWNWADPNPTLIGYEDQPNSITAVHLVAPKRGVFGSNVAHVVVVATAVEIILFGLSRQPNAVGSFDLAFIETRISTSIRGKDVRVLTASDSSGRIFFGDKVSNDVYELTYQQEERLFSSRCSWVNHTTSGLASLTPSFMFGTATHETIDHMVVDDSRNLLYTLSDRSTIRMFHLKSLNTLELAVNLPASQIFSSLHHMVSASPLIDQDTRIAAIQAITAQESNKLHLVAVTSSGCRIFLSAASSWGSPGNESSAPSNMRVQHVRFPPPDPGNPANQNSQVNNALDVTTKMLLGTRMAFRFAPGYFFCFPALPDQPMEGVFFSAPDSARIAQSPANSSQPAYHEIGAFSGLSGGAQDAGLCTTATGATMRPGGYGNEPAIQFDLPVVEVAILTNTGVEVFRRKRLVDVLASIIRSRESDDAFDYEIKRLVRNCGRSEVAATALAVACGQGLDQGRELSGRHLPDPEVIAQARKIFVEYGGKPTFNENAVVDQSVPQIDLVRPSPRHDGMAMYMARLIRSIWKRRVTDLAASPQGTTTLVATMIPSKLQAVQKGLLALQSFIDENRSFIEGLSGRDALVRNAAGQDEVAHKAEQRAMLSLVELLRDSIEGIAFVLVLFEENLAHISTLLTEDTKRRTSQTTYESLFTTTQGKELARELVKAVVNRSIASGSNIEAVTDALQRRCGSFCSPGDVIIFKAQEQVKRASEAAGSSDAAREQLRESLRLFESVAASLSRETVQQVTQQYTHMQFYAGAASLLLRCASEIDRGNQAAAYVKSGSTPQDPRKHYFDLRHPYYQLIFDVLGQLDEVLKQLSNWDEAHAAVLSQRAQEAYQLIEESTDLAFQNCLYDYYIEQGHSSRLLGTDAPEVIDYLHRKLRNNAAYGELLWQYHQQRRQFREAAQVLLDLAKDESDLSIQKRVDYLSKARVFTNSNAGSARNGGLTRTRGQTLLRDISELLDIANLQLDILVRLQADPRFTAAPASARHEELFGALSRGILPVSDLFNTYANPAEYWDLCLAIFQISDYRNSSQIRDTWQVLIDQAHNEAVAVDQAEPWEVVADRVRLAVQRLQDASSAGGGLGETIFPTGALMRMLQEYRIDFQSSASSPTWVSDVFVEIAQVPLAQVFDVLERMLNVEQAPLTGQNKQYLFVDLLHIIEVWYERARRSGATYAQRSKDSSRFYRSTREEYDDLDVSEDGISFAAKKGQIIEALAAMLSSRELPRTMMEEVRMSKVRIEQGSL